jgi:hypothetical protein
MNRAKLTNLELKHLRLLHSYYRSISDVNDEHETSIREGLGKLLQYNCGER